MNIFAIVFALILFAATLGVGSAIILQTAEIFKEFEIKLKEKVIQRHMKKYKRRIFYGK